MSNQPKKIVKAELAALVEAGKKRKELCEIYGLSELQMASVLRQAGLKIRKFHEPKWLLVDEAEEEAVSEDIVNPNQLEIPFANVSEEVETPQQEAEVQELINDKIEVDTQIPSYMVDELDSTFEEIQSEEEEDDFLL